MRAPLATIPDEVHCAEDYERVAAQFLAPATLAYLAGGSERDLAAARNRAAFDALAIWPRVLCDVTAGHTRLRLGGRELAHPVLLAPVAFQQLFHGDGELASARAAAATDSALVLSTLSSVALETVAEVAGAERWFQLYFQPQREVTRDLVARAAQAGYRAIVVTVDAPLQAASHRALEAGFRMPAGLVAANLTGYASSPVAERGSGGSRVFHGMMAGAPTWQDLEWLQAHCPLPLWVKGVLHPLDAQRLAAMGLTGLVVSNHGGRGLDDVPASLSALAAVRAALPRPFPLVLDGGVRRGADVFKALALGADAVLVGRLQAYAMAVAGALGVAHMLRLLREELEVCMALAGCATLADIAPDALAPAHETPVARLAP